MGASENLLLNFEGQKRLFIVDKKNVGKKKFEGSYLEIIIRNGKKITYYFLFVSTPGTRCRNIRTELPNTLYTSITPYAIFLKIHIFSNTYEGLFKIFCTSLGRNYKRGFRKYRYICKFVLQYHLLLPKILISREGSEQDYLYRYYVYHAEISTTVVNKISLISTLYIYILYICI